jgi:hypothetical protein
MLNLPPSKYLPQNPPPQKTQLNESTQVKYARLGSPDGSIIVLYISYDSLY